MIWGFRGGVGREGRVDGLLMFISVLRGVLMGCRYWCCFVLYSYLRYHVWLFYSHIYVYTYDG